MQIIMYLPVETRVVRESWDQRRKREHRNARHRMAELAELVGNLEIPYEEIADDLSAAYSRLQATHRNISPTGQYGRTEDEEFLNYRVLMTIGGQQLGDTGYIEVVRRPLGFYSEGRITRKLGEHAIVSRDTIALINWFRPYPYGRTDSEKLFEMTEGRVDIDTLGTQIVYQLCEAMLKDAIVATHLQIPDGQESAFLRAGFLPLNPEKPHSYFGHYKILEEVA